MGPTPPRTLTGRICELDADRGTLSMAAQALPAAHTTLFEQLQQLEKRLRSLARDGRVRFLVTAPGVGMIVVLTYASAIGDPGQFRSSKAVGAHFWLTPKSISRARPTSPVAFPRSETTACARPLRGGGCRRAGAAVATIAARDYRKAISTLEEQITKAEASHAHLSS